MKSLIVFYIMIFSYQTVFADVGLEFSRDIAESSFANNVSLSYSLNTLKDEETEVIGIAHYWRYTHTGSLFITTLNSARPDYEIKTLSHSLAYEATVVEALTLALKYATVKFNTDEATQNMLSGGLYYQLGNWQLGYISSSTDTFQNQSVVILGIDRKDQFAFNQKTASYYLGTRWTNYFMTSLNYTSYSYDKNLNNAYTLLTTAAVLDSAGGAVASQIAELINNSLDFNMSFLLSEKWLLGMGFGVAEDYLTPSSKTTSSFLGLDYEIEQDGIYYRVFALVAASKTPDVDGASGSGQLGMAVNF